MSYKPTDFFVGVIDFFAVLLPGAVATFLLRGAGVDILAKVGFTIGTSTGERWVVFVISSYVIGHVLAAFGDAILDRYYFDRWYSRGKRLNGKAALRKRLDALGGQDPEHPLAKLKGERFLQSRVLWILKLDKDDDLPEGLLQDPLLSLGKEIRDKAVDRLATPQAEGVKKKVSVFDWSLSTIRVRDAAASAEVDRTLGNSKFFRGMVFTFFVLGLWLVGCSLGAAWRGGVFSPKSAAAIVVSLGLAWISLWRYAGLRWKGMNRVYEYAAILAGIALKSSESEDDADGRSQSR